MTTQDNTKVPNCASPEASNELDTNLAQKLTVFPQDNGETTMIVSNKPAPTRLEELTSLVRENLRPSLDKSLQKELAELLSLVPELDSSLHERFFPLVEIAVLSLLSEKPNITLAEGIHKCIERRVRRSPLQAFIQIDGSPVSRVILGLGTLMSTVIPLALLTIGLLTVFDTQKIFGTDTPLLLLIATAGAVGGAVSIMVRLQEFEPLKKTDASILFLTGFFKPIIGTAFALFVFSALKSGWIPVNPPESTWYYFFPALAFISGFSERFAKDMITRAEDKMVADKTANP